MHPERINTMHSFPRAKGARHLKTGGQSKIRNVYLQVSARAFISRRFNGLECLMTNTFGGLTGGDKFANF